MQIRGSGPLITHHATTQIVCSLLTGTDCPYDVVLNYPFYIVSLIASMSTGACVFLTMCTTKVCTAYHGHASQH